MTDQTNEQTSAWHLMLCPFHDDHNPSLAYNDKEFICLACGQKGTADDLKIAIDQSKLEGNQ